MRFVFCGASKQQMKSLHFFGFSLLGGLLALFGSAGWSSYKHKKIPEKGVLFRWFVAGLVAVGIASYVWLFGANGDAGQLMGSMSQALDLTTLTKLVSVGALVAGSSSALSEEAEKEGQAGGDAGPELTVGMPSF